MLYSAALVLGFGCEAVPGIAPISVDGIPRNYHLIHEGGFESRDAVDAFVFSDPEAWRWLQVDGRGLLNQFTQSRYEPPHRSPVNLALLADHAFDDFVMEFEVRQTGRDYGHRDACFVFGFEDPRNFYYVHLAQQADDRAHSVFMVNESPRVSIATGRSEGIDWGDGWHTVRIERVAANGAIFVFFDDMQTPIMWAKDETFRNGRVGFGTFDDSMMIRGFRIWAPQGYGCAGERNPFVELQGNETTEDTESTEEESGQSTKRERVKR